jgi:hypothetical protein
MPAMYEKSGLCFEYPETWLLEEGGQEDETDDLARLIDEDELGAAARDADGPVSVTVHSPAGAFWTVLKYRGASDPRRYLEASLSAMREEYDDLDVEPAEESLCGYQLTGYDLNFFYLDLTNTTHIRGLKTLGSTLLIFCQADDGEWERIEGVFQAMTASLLEHQACSKEARWLPR